MTDLPVPKAAERLGVTRVTIWNWIQEGKFPHAYQLSPSTPGSPYRIPEEDVIAFEEKRKGHQASSSQANND